MSLSGKPSTEAGEKLGSGCLSYVASPSHETTDLCFTWCCWWTFLCFKEEDGDETLPRGGGLFPPVLFCVVCSHAGSSAVGRSGFKSLLGREAAW